MKTVVCYGDSNTWGSMPKKDRPDSLSNRYDFKTRWPGVLQQQLGDGFRVIEEGLNGRTTAFSDPLNKRLNGLEYIDCALMTNMPVDIVIIMLGTNDTKSYLGQTPFSISSGLEQLILRAKSGDYGKDTKVLVVAPAPVRDNVLSTWPGDIFGESSIEKSKALAGYYERVAVKNGCFFLNAGEKIQASEVDAIHLDDEAHKKLAEAIYDIIHLW